MNIAPVRTIKVTDTLGHPAPDEIMSMESHKRRKNVLTALDAILVQRNRELQEELVKPNPDKEYIEYIAEHPEYHDASLKVERMMERAAGAFEGSDENRMLVTLQVFKEEGSSTAGNDAPYYHEIERLTTKLREEYREFVS